MGGVCRRSGEPLGFLHWALGIMKNKSVDFQGCIDHFCDAAKGVPS